MSARARRLARGWAGAAVATAFATASHVAAGGQGPALMLVLLSLALSGPLCVAMAARVLSRSSLLAGVVVSQGIFHLFFTTTGSVRTVVDATHHAVGAVPADGPALVLEAQAHVEHGGTGMIFFHAAAAVLAYGFLRHGEVTLVALLQALCLRVRRLRRLLSVPFLAHWARPVPEGRPHTLTDQSLLRPVRSHRGPPAGPRRSPLPLTRAVGCALWTIG